MLNQDTITASPNPNQARQRYRFKGWRPSTRDDVMRIDRAVDRIGNALHGAKWQASARELLPLFRKGPDLIAVKRMPGRRMEKEKFSAPERQPEAEAAADLFKAAWQELREAIANREVEAYSIDPFGRRKALCRPDLLDRRAQAVFGTGAVKPDLDTAFY